MMTLASLMAPTFTNHYTTTLPNYHATHSTDSLKVTSSVLKGISANLHFRFLLRQPLLVARLSTLKRRELKPTNLTFAIPNESDQVERGSSHSCADDHILSPSESNESSNNPDADVVSSVLCTYTDVTQLVEHLGNQGSVLDKLRAIHLHILASEQWNASLLNLCHRNFLVSATNLIHFLALRCLDIENLNENLSSIGLLNLESINCHVLPSLAATIQLLENLRSTPSKTKESIGSGASTLRRACQNEKFTTQAMRKMTSANREVLLGPLQEGKTTHIMATVGEEATKSQVLITDLMKAGATIFRINCAHGTPSIWSEIIRKIKQSSQMLEIPCRVLMDLAGPKLRTGKLKPGPRVLKVSPKKNGAGNVIFPAQVWLSHKNIDPPAQLSLDAVLYIDNQKFLSEIEVGDSLRFYDARGKKRTLKISRKFHVFSSTGCVAECTRAAYVQSGTKLYVKGKKGRSSVGRVVDVPATEPFVRLRAGDLLTISRGSSSEEHEFCMSADGAYRITCSSGYLFDSVKPGEPIAFDDGKIWGVIQGTSISEIVVSITRAGPKGTKLGSEKSINIPESDIRFEGLTSKDLMDIEFIAANADIVGFSFVRDIRDIIVLRQELEKRKARNLGIVLKIETKSGFEKLPSLLLEAMKSSNPLGVMIARGDLAVECGWERLAEMQEEILSVCGAAHIPVIWATQVLESLLKSALPTRAEITDAANGRRASCVMLNKGEHIVAAVSSLDKILHVNCKPTKAELKSILLSNHLS